jgi:hypothetical protein
MFNLKSCAQLFTVRTLNLNKRNLNPRPILVIWHVLGTKSFDSVSLSKLIERIARGSNRHHLTI